MDLPYLTIDHLKKTYIQKHRKYRTSDLWVVVADKKKCHKDLIADDSDILEGYTVCIWEKNEWRNSNTQTTS